MLGRMRTALALALLVSLAACGSAAADVSMPAIFGDGMVLQRRAPLPVWGTADAGEKVTVTLDKQSKTVTAGEDGKWRVTLDPVEAGGPWVLGVKGKNALSFTDVLGGEVWLCGGQSNMEWVLQNASDAKAALAAADRPKLRVFGVAKAAATQPAADVGARWQVASPQTVGGFSAVGYFFGVKLQEALDVPVGLIGSYWGGTRVEPWMTPDAMEAAGFADRMDAAREQMDGGAFAGGGGGGGGGPSGPLTDTGIAKPNWAKPILSMNGWGKAELPGPFLSDEVDFDGVAWYRKGVTVPADWGGQDLVLSLGTIDDCDVTYFNGVEVGRTGPGNNSWFEPRTYRVPGKLVQGGRNRIAVRVFDSGGGGGFTGAAEQMYLARAGVEGARLPMSGEWRVAIERLVTRDPDNAARAEPQGVPTMLYNGMIAPLTPYAVRGFLWYQGESNAGEAGDYAALLRGMIGAWREHFDGPKDQAEQPFLIVQLANFQARSADANVAPGWADLREAQREVAGDPGNGLAVTIDVGDAGDIHPRDKHTVGDRLARVALHDVYGDKGVVADGPTLASATVSGGNVVLKFDHADGLTLKGDAAQTFAVAGADGRFVWATPTVKGDTLVLDVDSVSDPKTVRYAWQMNPPAPLYNAAGLPAVPFEAKLP